jgi:peptide/nickel transport system ATP-binding protein
LAQDICADQEPPLRGFGTDGHQAACHFPLGTNVSADNTSRASGLV